MKELCNACANMGKCDIYDMIKDLPGAEMTVCHDFESSTVADLKLTKENKLVESVAEGGKPKV